MRGTDLNTLAKPRPNCPSPPVMRVRGVLPPPLLQSIDNILMLDYQAIDKRLAHELVWYIKSRDLRLKLFDCGTRLKKHDFVQR